MYIGFSPIYLPGIAFFQMESIRPNTGVRRQSVKTPYQELQQVREIPSL